VPYWQHILLVRYLYDTRMVESNCQPRPGTTLAQEVCASAAADNMRSRSVDCKRDAQLHRNRPTIKVLPTNPREHQKGAGAYSRGARHSRRCPLLTSLAVASKCRVIVIRNLRAFSATSFTRGLPWSVSTHSLDSC